MDLFKQAPVNCVPVSHHEPALVDVVRMPLEEEDLADAPLLAVHAQHQLSVGSARDVVVLVHQPLQRISRQPRGRPRSVGNNV